VVAARYGYSCEDKYINCQLLKHGRVGYLVFRFGYNMQPAEKCPSIVDEVSSIITESDIAKAIHDATSAPSTPLSLQKK